MPGNLLREESLDARINTQPATEGKDGEENEFPAEEQACGGKEFDISSSDSFFFCKEFKREEEEEAEAEHTDGGQNSVKRRR